MRFAGISAVARWVMGLVVTVLMVTGLVMTGLWTTAANADTESAESLLLSRVKAAFIFNIGKFVAWPQSVLDVRPEQFHLCTYRHSIAAAGFDQVVGKYIQRRRVALQPVGERETAAGCDILVFAEADRDIYQRPSSLALEAPVLTVLDMTGAGRDQTAYTGMTINLVRRGSGIGFEVNMDAVKQRQLILSSELLKLATIVSGEGAR